MQKHTILRASLLLLLAMLMLCSLLACNKVEKTGAWENATYRSDKTFGKGEKTITVTVKAEEQSVVFTVHSDKGTVGEALLEHELIAGEQGAYGLYIKTVNGMTADYDTDGTYWAFYVGDAYSMTGVDTTPFEDGDSFVLAKE